MDTHAKDDGVADLGEAVAVTLAQLRAVLEAVESGELAAGPEQRAWLRGAIDALQTVQAPARA